MTKTLEHLVAELCAAREDRTPGGAVIADTCLASHLVGRILWQVRKQTCGPYTVSTYLVCCPINGCNSVGWEAEELPESSGLPCVNCPLDFLAQTKVVSYEWRDRVWKWHEAELTRQLERRSPPTKIPPSPPAAGDVSPRGTGDARKGSGWKLRT